jgi:hypothetical protein
MYFKKIIIIKLLIFWIIFDKVQAQFGFRIRSQIHNLKLHIRILQKVADPDPDLDPQHWYKAQTSAMISKAPMFISFSKLTDSTI